MQATFDSGKKIVGTKQVKRALAKGKVKKVYIAKDADKKITSEIIKNCSKENVEIIYIDTMEKLGKCCNIDVNAASAAILK